MSSLNSKEMPRNIVHIWSRYLAFENCCRRKDLQLDEFLKKWKKKMTEAKSAGCQYSDTVLACKLLEKANLTQPEIFNILSTIDDGLPESELFLNILSTLESSNSQKGRNGRTSSLNIPVKDEFKDDLKYLEPVKQYQDLNYSVTQNGNTIKSSMPCDGWPEIARSQDKADRRKCLKCAAGYLERSPEWTESDIAKVKFSCNLCDFIFWDNQYEEIRPRDRKDQPEDEDNGILVKVEPAFMAFDVTSEDFEDFSNNSTSPPVPRRKRRSNLQNRKCELCAKAFSRPVRLKEHYIKQHGMSEDEVMANKDNIQRENYEQDVGNPENPNVLYGTNERDENWNQGSEIVREEMKRTTHRCDICEKEFQRPCHLEAHKLKHHGCGENASDPPLGQQNSSQANENTPFQQADPPLPPAKKRKRAKAGSHYQCEFCGRKFPWPGLLNKHYEEHYDETDGDQNKKRPSVKKSPVCKICGKQFAKLSYYKFHMKSHSGEKNYTCEECSQSFVHYFSLIYHKRKHSGERKYKCDQCLKEYFTSSNLKMHIRQVHVEERPFKCDQCNYSSAKKANLERHMSSHSCEKPFKCEVCEKAFKDNCSKKRHLKSHFPNPALEPQPLGV